MHLICPPKFCVAFVFHFSWVLQLSQEELKTALTQNFGEQMQCIMGDVQVANWKNVIFDNVWILSENHPKAFWMFADVNNSVQKLRQLSAMYCAIWLVDFWPITILVKYLSFRLPYFMFSDQEQLK